MKLKLYKTDGSLSGETEIADFPQFEGRKGQQAVKEVIVAQAANIRQGSANTKQRGEVRGGGRKPWRQKGTGRARAGSNRSPLWVGGGVVFGPKPRDYSKKTNRKVRQLAFARALFDRSKDGGLQVIESLDIAPAKTRVASELLEKVAPDGPILLVDSKFSDTTLLAVRNIARVYPEEAASLNVTELAKFRNIIVTSSALDVIVERLKGGSK